MTARVLEPLRNFTARTGFDRSVRARRMLTVVLALALSLALAGVARAAGPVFSEPVRVAGDANEARLGGGLPRALLAADGRTTVAWPGMGHGLDQPPTGREGVFVSELPPGGGT